MGTAGTGGSAGTAGTTGGAGVAGGSGAAGSIGLVLPHRRLGIEQSYGCALRSNGRLSCWGAPRQGFPLTTVNDQPFTAVAAGLDLVCGLDADGRVTCDGLFNGEPFEGDRLRSIATGDEVACGIAPMDDSVHCWPDAASGLDNAPSGGFVQVSVGYVDACAIARSDRHIECWGAAPSLESQSGEFAQISVGRLHLCAIRTDGTLACWLGTRVDASPDTDTDDDWGQADPPSGTFVQVDTGVVHTCGIRSDHTVACWGAGSRLGTLAECEADVDQCGMAAAPSGTFDEISAASFHTCGIRTTGELECWGITTTGDPPDDFE
jgi:hypothetical protein